MSVHRVLRVPLWMTWSSKHIHEQRRQPDQELAVNCGELSQLRQPRQLGYGSATVAVSEFTNTKLLDNTAENL